MTLNVAQTSSLLYRGLPARRTSLGSLGAHSNPGLADWKSAIQQARSLRYAAYSAPSDMLPEGAA